MMTQTHMLMASGLLARKRAPAVNLAAVAGGFLPDAALFVMFAWTRFVDGVSAETIFSTLYFTPTWQTIQAISHGFPMWVAVLSLGFLTRLDWLKVFAIAGLFHAGTDFLLHHDDAHSQFWPFTMWKFQSPVSYWDPQYYGSYFQVFELALSLFFMVLIWRRFSAVWVRVLMGIAAALYIAVPAYFILTLT